MGFQAWTENILRNKWRDSSLRSLISFAFNDGHWVGKINVGLTNSVVSYFKDPLALAGMNDGGNIPPMQEMDVSPNPPSVLYLF
jgi:hypothetical protein